MADIDPPITEIMLFKFYNGLYVGIRIEKHFDPLTVLRLGGHLPVFFLHNFFEKHFLQLKSW